MKLHFEFKLATFRIREREERFSRNGLEKTILVGSSKELDRSYIQLIIEGIEKNVAFTKELSNSSNCILLYSVNANLTIFPGITIFAIAKIPRCKNFKMEDLEYLVVHSNTKDMHEFINLEKVDAYLYQWQRKNFLFDIL